MKTIPFPDPKHEPEPLPDLRGLQDWIEQAIASGKLQGETDELLKRVNEAVDQFEEFLIQSNELVIDYCALVADFKSTIGVIAEMIQ